MWRLRILIGNLWWEVDKIYLKFAVRAWLNRAWYRNGDRLMYDLQALERRPVQRLVLEPPYEFEDEEEA